MKNGFSKLSLAAKIFIVYGIVLCALIGYGNWVGWVLSDSFMSGSWDPQGRGQHGGPRSGSFWRYHK